MILALNVIQLEVHLSASVWTIAMQLCWHLHTEWLHQYPLWFVKSFGKTKEKSSGWELEFLNRADSIEEALIRHIFWILFAFATSFMYFCFWLLSLLFIIISIRMQGVSNEASTTEILALQTTPAKWKSKVTFRYSKNIGLHQWSRIKSVKCVATVSFIYTQCAAPLTMTTATSR